jgi:hypothetical protein
MPTLRLVYLTEQQYADMTEHAHAANNNTTEQQRLPSINQQQTRLVPAIATDATRKSSSNKPPPVGEEKKMEVQSEDNEEDKDNDYHLDTLLQEAIDGVSNRRSFGGHAVQHQQVQVSSDEESENDCSIPSPSPAQADADAVQQKSGNKRKRPALLRVKHSFDDRFTKLMAFKAKYGHCNVSQRGEDASLGKWCGQLRLSYKKIQSNQKPNIKLSDEQIQRLTGAGFKWSLKVGLNFDERFNDLMSFKAKCGHCDVPCTGDNASLGHWCSEKRASYKKIQNNQKPNIKLSDGQIQRLNGAGFKWSLRKVGLNFDERFNDLMSFKAKCGHCDVPCTGDNASLGHWCSEMRVSYKKIQSNQKPNIKLSDEQIKRLNDAGFKWSLRKVGLNFDERFNDLMSFKAKYGHCNVSQHGEDASLGQWCSNLRGSYKKIHNQQKPIIKLSDEQIQRLNDAGFKWSLKVGLNFDERFNDLMSFKAKYGHCDVPCTGDNAALGQWCSHLRGSYKKIHNQQKPKRKLSDEQIQRLNDADFKWSLKSAST